MPVCSINPVVPASQPPASAIPGNIGIARAKVLIWDNDPLFGRAHQQYGFPFSSETARQLEDSVPNAAFGPGSVCLKPRFEIQDIWLATKKPTDKKTEGAQGQSKTKFELDYVRPSTVGAQNRFPKGTDGSDGTVYDENGSKDDTTGRDIFPHQVWIHIGNLLKRGIPLHPSEYDIPLAEVKSAEDLKDAVDSNGNHVLNFDGFSIPELQAAPKWAIREMKDDARIAYWPLMINKQPADSWYPIHWTIEKLTPVWQGTDFFVTVYLGEQELDQTKDPDPKADDVNTNWEEYKYLLYNPKETPKDWKEGISNEAFYVAPQRKQGAKAVTQEEQEKALDNARKAYWWKYKSYVLIEIGPGDKDHNYFIEIVKGRRPRLLHLGEEWDNTKRLESGAISSSEDWMKVKKCRVLSEYELASDELFKKKDFRVSVFNQMGRLVIVFEGYEDAPWVITRQDNDPTRFDYAKLTVPIVVPNGKLRIHGGNISCAVGYAPIRYVPSCEMTFPDRQLDSFEAEDDDLYITFANIGNAVQYRNDRVHRVYFNDKRFAIRQIGYTLDAYNAEEIHKNAVKTVKVYETFAEQYYKWGKGWVNHKVQLYTRDVLTGTLIPTGTSFSMRTNTMLESEGVPHTASLFNAKQPNTKFVFGLNEDPYYPYEEYVSVFDVGVRLNAGSPVMPIFEGDENIDVIDTNAKPKVFKDYVTPVVPMWNLILLGGAKPFADKVANDELELLDISDLVVNINDSWSADGFTRINHEMKIRCYIPDSFLPNTESPGPGQIDQNLYAMAQKLLALHKQSFYVTVSYWWENGVGERDAPDNIIARGGSPHDSDLLIQMTGIVPGASLEKSVNKLFMDFTVKDYSWILEKQNIFNSPFFDGVTDSSAILELARMAYFDDSYEQVAGVNRQPLAFLVKTIVDPYVLHGEPFRYNGEECRYRIYDLPGSYSDLANPAMRFQNGETYMSAMTKIASLATKVIYFDRWGVLKFESAPAIEAAFMASERQQLTPKFCFVTSPFNPAAAGGDPDTRRFIFDPNQHASHLVYEVVTYSRSLEDCIDQIILYSASNDILLADGTRTGGFIVEGYTFFEQIFDPTAEGFFGFRKPFYQSNGIFGDLKGVRNALQHYAQMKYPIAQISFQTYGVPGLKPLDIISLDDNLFYITEISHELDPSTNRWWMNISAEWLKPFTGTLGFLEERGNTDSGVPSEEEEGGGEVAP